MTLSPIHITVLDKDGSLAIEANKYLYNTPFTVTGATDPQAVIDTCKTKPPAVLIVRTALNGISAAELCKSVRAVHNKEKLPIILVADSHEITKVREGYKQDISDVLTTPVNWLVMQRRIHDLIRANRMADELKGSEVRLYHAQKAAQLGTWEYNSKDKSFVFSKNAFQVFGIRYGDEPLTKEHFLHVFHPADREEFSRLLGQARTRHIPFNLQHRILRYDGSVRYINHQVSFVRNEALGIKAILGTAQDITEQKLPEYLEVDKNSVLKMIINDLPLIDVLSEVTRIVDHQRPNASTLICLSSNNRLAPIVASRLPAGFIKQFMGQEIGPRSGGATAAYVGETIIASDIFTHPLWEGFRSRAEKYGIQACFADPILSGKGQVLGVILIFYKETHKPNEADLSLLKAVTDLASVAIEKVRMTEDLVYQAKHDELTGLANRNALREWLEKSLVSAKRYDEQVAILYIDLDRFKQVNDSLGHETGDLLLKDVVRRLSSIVRESDILARMGGDEFVLAAGRIEEKEDAKKLARRILQISSQAYHINGHELYVDASIGISFFPSDATEPEALVRYADTAMYYAKNKGGNRLFEFEPKMKKAVIERLQMENDLRKGMERGELELFYQPQYELADKRLIGFEALLRWNHPDLGRIAPLKFIPLAEETGLIMPIGEWVLHEACRQNVRWMKSGYGPFKIAVNVSSIQFTQGPFLDILNSAIADSGMDSQYLEIELTESLLINDMKFVANMLEEIKSLGATTAIDDFGTGYSSMSYLHKLPLDCLKIDRAFIINTEEDSHDAQKKRDLFKKIVEISHSLGLKVVAEGFDNKVQYDYLLSIGCDIGQGYFLGVPMPAREIEFYCSLDDV